MCRYSMFSEGKTHWVCVSDRRSFKAIWQATCPDCRQPMFDVGRDFHVPRRADVRQWRKVGLLVERGLLFHSCGCSGPGPRPRTLGDARSEFGLRRSDRRHRTFPPS